MARPKSHKPKYCFHKTSGRAFVRIADRQIWLGKFGSQESKDKYDAVVGQWMSQGRPAGAPFAMSSADGITIIELVEAYWNFAKEYYKNDPMRSDGHRISIRGALDLIVPLFGETPVSEFGPLKLTVVLDEMIKPKKVQAKRRAIDSETGTSEMKLVEIERRGWTRGYANSQLKRLKRMFGWGEARELLPLDAERQVILRVGLPLTHATERHFNHHRIMKMSGTTTAEDRCRGVLVGLAAGDRIGGPIRMAVRLAESLIDCAALTHPTS